MRFGSVCSGIEAASLAFAPFGWRAAWLAEVDVAAAQVLAYRLDATAPIFPLDPEEEGLSAADQKARRAAIKTASRLNWGNSLPNYGDMTRIAALIRSGEIEAPDALVGGTPCQSFSLAGLRRGLADARGQLTLAFCDLADAIDEIRIAHGDEPCVVMWENVPGVLTHKDNPFGCFLAALAGEDVPIVAPGGKWTNAGFVVGPKRTVAWRLGNAEYFGLAQRRNRLFVVASAVEGFDPGAVLFEFEGVRRDTAPSREAGREVAGTLDARTSGGGFPGTDGACAGHVQPHERLGRPIGVEPTWWDGRDVSQTLDAVLYKGQTMPEKNRFPAVLQPVPQCFRTTGNCGAWNTGYTTDALTCSTDPNSHVITYPILEAGARTGASTNDPRAGMGVGGPNDPMFTLQASKQHAVGFSCKDYGGDAADDLAPTMRAMGHAGSHANAGGQIAVAYSVALRGREEGGSAELGDDISNALRASQGGGDKAYCVTGEITHTLKADGFDGSEDGTGRGQPIVNYNMAVRRLLPVECERLQGFPDNWTLVPVGKKMAADGPRYKQLGNSWAVTHARWVAGRIDAEYRRVLATRITLNFEPKPSVTTSELLTWAMACAA